MKILKPGEEGYGYIIEYDAGYVNSNISHRGKKNGDIINETLLREFKNNLTSDGPLPDKIELYAVLQKWGVENKNGRVYTEEILRREADRYQEFIDMGTSLGELNHPESSLTCVDPFMTIENNDHGRFLKNNEEENFDFNISNCNNSDKISIRKITSDKYFETNDKYFNFQIALMSRTDSLILMNAFQ